MVAPRGRALPQLDEGSHYRRNGLTNPCDHKHLQAERVSVACLGV